MSAELRLSAALAALLLAALLPHPAAGDTACPSGGNTCRSDPFVIDWREGTIWQGTFSAGVEPGEPTPCDVGATRWYVFTPAVSGPAWVGVEGSSFPAVVAVYEDGAFLACRDPAPSPAGAGMLFDCVAGRTYEIQAGGHEGAQGTLQLDFDLCALAVGPASRPLGFAATPGQARGEVSLAWEAPRTDGGHPILSYEVEVSEWCDGGTAVVTLPPESRAYVVTGVEEARAWCWTVRAANALGPGDPATATAPALGLASAPLLAPANALAHEIRLAWSPPTTDGGSPVTAYLVERAAPGGDFVLRATVATPGTSYADTVLGEGETWTYRVLARNAHGDSAPSAARSATTPSRPGAPRDVVAHTSYLGPGIRVVWNAPASNGGMAIAWYDVLRAEEAEGESYVIARVGSGERQYVDAGAALDGARWYTVRATNPVGDGPVSTAACGEGPVVPFLLGRGCA